MSKNGGVITRKEIIEDEALAFGLTYTKNIQTAITANKELVSSVKELNKQVLAFKGVSSQKQFMAAKQAENLETQKAINNIKIQTEAELAAEKVKKSVILTLEQQRKAIQATADAQNKAQKIQATGKKLTVEERIQNEINNKQLKQEALERLGLVSAYTKLSKERANAKIALKELLLTEGASTEAIKKAQKEFDTLDGKIRKADAAVGDFTKNVGNYPKLTSFTDGIKNLIGAFGIGGGIAAFAGILSSAYQEVKQFEQGVADLSAITGASGKELDYLKNSAIELGKTTKGGATAVVEAYKLIGSAKPELLENVASLNQVTQAVLTLSKAAGMEMPEAAIALTGAMNQFGADASQAGLFIDTLANGAKYGAIEIPQTTEALLKFGAVAKNSGVSIQESVAAIQILGPSFKSVEEAGTGFRNLMLKITAPDALPKEAFKILSEALKESGVSIDYLKDKTIPFASKMEVLKPLLSDNSKLVKVFGVENVTAATTLLKQTDAFEKLIPKIKEFGSAEEQASIRMNTLQGKTDQLSSTYDSLVLSVNSGSGSISYAFKGFVDILTEGLEGLIRFNTSYDELYEKAKKQGASDGKKSFDKRLQIGKNQGADEKNVLNNIKGSAEEAEKRLRDEYAKNEKEVEKRAGQKAYFGLFGEDSFLKKAKENRERLMKEITFQVTLINEANAKLSPKKSDSAKKEQAKFNDTTDTPTDETQSKKTKADQKAAQDKLDSQRKLNDSLYELQKQRLEQTIKFNDEIVADDTQTDEMRLQALENSQDKQQALLLANRDHQLAKEKINADDRLRINEEYENKTIELNNKTKKEISRINQFDEAEYLKTLEDKVSKKNVAMNSELEAENKKFLALGDLEKLSQKDREAAIENHEKAIYEIKKRYAIEILKLQVANLEAELAASDLLPKSEQISTTKRQKIAETLSKAKLDITELETENHSKKADITIDKEAVTASKILDISAKLTAGLSDLGNAVFGVKIQQLDEEIAKNNEFYDNQIKLAGNDQRKKEILENERNKKNKAFEAEKRKEQHKQAVFNKAVAISQAGISASLAILAALNTTPFLPLGPAMATLAGVLGAIQIGAIIATPIPKYKHGRKGGPAETAWVGDGGVSEVIERASGGIQITPATDTLVKLNAGDKVHSSVDEYLKLQKIALLTSIDLQGRKASAFQAEKTFNNQYDKEILEELKRNTDAINKNKSSIVVHVPKLDIGHEIWKLKNTNWS